MGALETHQQAVAALATELQLDGPATVERLRLALGELRARLEQQRDNAGKFEKQAARRQLKEWDDRQPSIDALFGRQTALDTLVLAETALLAVPPRVAEAKHALARVNELAQAEGEAEFRFALEQRRVALLERLPSDTSRTTEAVAAAQTALRLGDLAAARAALEAARRELADLSVSPAVVGLQASLATVAAAVDALQPHLEVLVGLRKAVAKGHPKEIATALRRAEGSAAGLGGLAAEVWEAALGEARRWLEERFDWSPLERQARETERLRQLEHVPETQLADNELAALLELAPACPRRQAFEKRREAVAEWLSRTDVILTPQLRAAEKAVFRHISHRGSVDPKVIQQQFEALRQQLPGIRDSRERQQMAALVGELEAKLLWPPVPPDAPRRHGILMVPDGLPPVRRLANREIRWARAELWLAAGPQFALGRREDRDFVTRHLPENDHHKRMNERISRQHATFVREADGRLQLYDGEPGRPSLAGVRLNETPVDRATTLPPPPDPLRLDIATTYRLEASWCPGLEAKELSEAAKRAGQTDAATRGATGALLFQPTESAIGFRRGVWLLTDAALGSRPECPCWLPGPQVPPVAAHFLVFGDRIFLRTVVPGLRLDQETLPADALRELKETVTLHVGGQTVFLYRLQPEPAAT